MRGAHGPSSSLETIHEGSAYPGPRFSTTDAALDTNAALEREYRKLLVKMYGKTEAKLVYPKVTAYLILLGNSTLASHDILSVSAALGGEIGIEVTHETGREGDVCIQNADIFVMFAKYMGVTVHIPEGIPDETRHPSYTRSLEGDADESA